jgi:DNA-binding transcriptional MerR regulator
MSAAMSIGNFARATHLTVKTLRHYHDAGLLEPAQVDPQTGYRLYTAEQIPKAQIIRRFRALEMPVAEIRALLSAPDLSTRNELISAHLRHLESDLARTQAAVASLRALLEPPPSGQHIARRSVARVAAAAIRETIEVKDALGWLLGALGELRATVAAPDRIARAAPGGIYSNALFTHGRGAATLFIPCAGPVRAVGRVISYVVPAVELATIVHEGPHTNVDLAYGALATYVSHHELAVEGPLREYYLIGPGDTSDQSAWRTEIGWPIF